MPLVWLGARASHTIQQHPDRLGDIVVGRIESRERIEEELHSGSRLEATIDDDPIGTVDSAQSTAARHEARRRVIADLHPQLLRETFQFLQLLGDFHSCVRALLDP